MEILIEKARDYITALQKAGGFTNEDTANLSGVPLQTFRNFITGKSDKNPGFLTIAKIVTALGGDMNELIGYEKKKEIEINSMVSLKETYEMRIADIINANETRIEDIKALCEERIADVIKCCESRISDMKAMYEHQMKLYQDIIKELKG